MFECEVSVSDGELSSGCGCTSVIFASSRSVSPLSMVGLAIAVSFLLSSLLLVFGIVCVVYSNMCCWYVVVRCLLTVVPKHPLPCPIIAWTRCACLWAPSVEINSIVESIIALLVSLGVILIASDGGGGGF